MTMLTLMGDFLHEEECCSGSSGEEVRTTKTAEAVMTSSSVVERMKTKKQSYC